MGYIYGCVLSYSVNFKSKEFSLSYSELSESCAIAELTNLLEPIVTNTTGFSGVFGNNVGHCGIN